KRSGDICNGRRYNRRPGTTAGINVATCSSGSLLIAPVVPHVLSHIARAGWGSDRECPIRAAWICGLGVVILAHQSIAATLEVAGASRICAAYDFIIGRQQHSQRTGIVLLVLSI